MERKTQLTLEELRKITEAPESNDKSLALLILTTGMHPACISSKQEYDLGYDKEQVTWRRTKTHKKIMLAWRRPMLEQDRYLCIPYWKKQCRQWMHRSLTAFGMTLGIIGLTPLLLRRAYFVNMGRLNFSQMDIQTESQTSWETILQYYSFGKGQHKRLSDEDRKLLEWMYE